MTPPRLIVVMQPTADDALRAEVLPPDALPLRLPETTYLTFLLHYPDYDGDTQLWVGDESWPLEPLAPGWWVARDQLTDESIRVRFNDVESGLQLTLRPSFRNRFGQCVLRLTSPDEETIPLGTLLFTNTKASEAQLGRMLVYLWERQTGWFDGPSRVGVDHLLPPDSVFGTLARLRADLLFLHRQQPLFRLLPQTRLLPVRQRLANPTPDQLTEAALAFVLENPYCLEPVEAIDSTTLIWQQTPYRLRETETDLLHENTDTPENRLLHGYLTDVAQYLATLPETLAANSYAEAPVWQREAMTRRIRAEAGRLLQLITDWQAFAQVYLPVRYPEFVLPNALTGFDHSDHYRHTGRLIRTWFSTGRAVGLGAEPSLSGIRSVDTLYELVCLFRWLDAWQQQGYVWQSFEPAPKAMPSPHERRPEQGFYYLNHPNGSRVLIAYECLPSHYQITVPYRKSMPLRPDFVVEWTTAEGHSHYLVADAKFRPALPVREHELPGLVMKYGHGISPDRSRRPAPTNRGLLLLHPTVPPNVASGREGFWFWQFPRFDPFGDQPAPLQIGQVAVSVDNSDDYLGRLVNRLLS
ncbi:MAG: hypothetical protein EAZ91_02845 [Cytophagales bacterium]|nr:MAG: hypothetical protein EAZ91_02845 [Cytophagales bacterium]